MRILILFVTLLFLTAANTPQDNHIVVIVNIDNPNDKLTATEVRTHWLRRPKKQWDKNGKGIKPADYKGKTGDKDIFYKYILKMPEDVVEKYFISCQYQNGEKPADKFNSEREMLEFVGNEIGAIGYVNKNAITPDKASKVKVVFEF